MEIFYDTHAHLHYPDYSDRMADVVRQAREAGVSRIITAGTDLDSSRRAVALADAFPEIYAAVGWHPNDAMAAPDDIAPDLLQLAAHPKVVAIGEIGLDYYRLPGGPKAAASSDTEPFRRKQAQVFEQQLALAAKLGHNVIIHQRESLAATIDQVRPWSDKLRAVFHCFSGDTAALHRILDMGSLVSYTGILTFKNGGNVRDALTATPFGQFMLETDCPYLTPEPHRKVWPCEPAHLRFTAIRAAEVKACSLTQLSEATCTTAHQFFKRLN